MHQLSEMSQESYKRETFFLDLPESNSVKSFEHWNLKSTSCSKDILSPESKKPSGMRGNQSGSFDQTEIILPADFIKTLSSTGWISESQIKIKAETCSLKSPYKLQLDFNHQVTADNEKQVAR